MQGATRRKFMLPMGLTNKQIVLKGLWSGLEATLMGSFIYALVVFNCGSYRNLLRGGRWLSVYYPLAGKTTKSFAHGRG